MIRLRQHQLFIEKEWKPLHSYCYGVNQTEKRVFTQTIITGQRSLSMVNKQSWARLTLSRVHVHVGLLLILYNHAIFL